MRELRLTLEPLERDGWRVSERVAVVIPTLNEAESIGAVIAALPRYVVDDVIVADGGSTDGTPQIARRVGAEIIAVGPGYGRACLAGAEAAGDADILVFMSSIADSPIRCTFSAMAASFVCSAWSVLLPVLSCNNCPWICRYCFWRQIAMITPTTPKCVQEDVDADGSVGQAVTVGSKLGATVAKLPFRRCGAVGRC